MNIKRAATSATHTTPKIAIMIIPLLQLTKGSKYAIILSFKTKSKNIATLNFKI